MTDTRYNAILSKGQGMIPETITLLKHWQPGMSTEQLCSMVIRDGVIPRATAYRVSDIVKRVFAARYLRNDGLVARWLKTMVDRDFAQQKLGQLFLIYTARENLILHDFICEVYWPQYAAGATAVFTQEAIDFFKSATAAGKIPKKWSDGVSRRLARQLLGCLSDFKLTGDYRNGRRLFLPFMPLAATSIFLAHEIHFTGASDNVILTHPDWRLFGLESHSVLEELRKVAGEGRFIVQSSGDLLRVSWGCKSMEECIDVLTQG